jgi:hypothetical protein
LQITHFQPVLHLDFSYSEGVALMEANYPQSLSLSQSIIIRKSTESVQKLSWACDIHLDHAGLEWKKQVLERLAVAGHDGVAFTGDIADSNPVVETATIARILRP